MIIPLVISTGIIMYVVAITMFRVWMHGVYFMSGHSPRATGTIQSNTTSRIVGSSETKPVPQAGCSSIMGLTGFRSYASAMKKERASLDGGLIRLKSTTTMVGSTNRINSHVPDGKANLLVGRNRLGFEE